jgi:hypothetical protein
MLDLFGSPALARPSAAAPQEASALDRLKTTPRVFAALLGNRRPTTRADYTGILAEAMGGTDGDGKWSPRDAYDAAEAGLGLALNRLGAIVRPSTRLAGNALDLIGSLEALLPSQTRRTVDGETMQQFSAPPTIGWIAARALAITERDLVLEPSAGNGLLAVMAHIAGARLVLNELCPTRRGLLGEVLGPATGIDALYLGSLLPQDITPAAACTPRSERKVGRRAAGGSSGRCGGTGSGPSPAVAPALYDRQPPSAAGRT